MGTFRYFIELAYKGTNYHGWQVQTNANSVQQELNQAISTLMNYPVATTGCGRTDTSVHAEQFFAHFDTQEKIEDGPQFLFKLNGVLPYDISVFKIFSVPEEANVRFDATSRTYAYRIAREKDPFNSNSSYYLFGKLDITAMHKAALLLKTYSDFSCFCKTGTPHQTHVCSVTQAQWEESDKQLIFTITANRFLRGMVRAIVGTSIELGRGQITLDQFKKIIEGKKREDAGYAVPPHGLYLTNIRYPEHLMQPI